MVNVDNINLENLSIADLTSLEERIRAAKMIPAGLMAVAKASALKTLISDIRSTDPETLGQAFEGITPQALPKETNIGKRYGLSESQIAKARDLGVQIAGKIDGVTTLK